MYVCCLLVLNYSTGPLSFTYIAHLPAFMMFSSFHCGSLKLVKNTAFLLWVFIRNIAFRVLAKSCTRISQTQYGLIEQLYYPYTPT